MWTYQSDNDEDTKEYIYGKKENEKQISKIKDINDGNNNKILTYNKIDLSTSTMEYILQKIPEHIRPNIDWIFNNLSQIRRWWYIIGSHIY